jgi:hypothetical protein
MILRLLKGRGIVSGLFEKKRDAMPPHPVSPQALVVRVLNFATSKKEKLPSAQCAYITKFIKTHGLILRLITS